MRKRLGRKQPPQDTNQVAFRLVKKATEPPPQKNNPPTPDEISRVMAAMGRKGGLKGGRKRMTTMSPEQRREAASRAARARWTKAKQQKP